MTDLPAPLAPPPDFLASATALGIEFEPGDVERLGQFLAIMLAANETTNLTAITDPAEAWRRHILDALTLVPVLASIAPAAEGSETGSEAGDAPSASAPASEAPAMSSLRPVTVVDIGSGGGVPAIPLAIVMPDTRFTLVEATGRKVEFLRNTIAALGLKNARVMNARAEALGQDHRSHREHYDAATARALGHLSIVCELAGPLVRQRGFVIATKGGKAEQELAESARALGAIGLRHTETIDTPTGKLIVLEKTIRTPRLYPRRDGEPARSPLK